MPTDTRSYIERQLAAQCPGDTDGDGDCGRPLCAWCGPAFASARFEFARDLAKAMAGDVWGNQRISQWAIWVNALRWNISPEGLERFETHQACMALLGLHWGWDPEQAKEDPGYWTSPGEFLDEHLHLTRGSHHVDIISDLINLARQIDPDRDDLYPGGRANHRSPR